MPSVSAGIGSQKNICHKTQTAGQAFTACPAAFSARILKNVFFVYGGADFEPHYQPIDMVLFVCSCS